MQIISHKGLKPLTIAASIFMTGNIAYAEMDQISKITSVINNQHVSQYVKTVDFNIDNSVLNRRKFYTYYNSWEKHTRFLSSAKAITDHPGFRGIVSMGYDAVPFIMEVIDNKPSTLVWALNLIFNHKISNNPKTTVSEACKLWVKALKN